MLLGAGAELEGGDRNEASLVAENDHSADMGYTVELCRDYGTVEEMVVDNSSRCTGACTHCTEVPLLDMAESDDYKVFSFPYPVACLALPADDDRSSCRLANVYYFPNLPPSRFGLEWKERRVELILGFR